MKKKLLLALVVSVLLVGCGSTDTTDNAQGTEAPQTQEEQKQEEPPHEHTYTESITTEATCEADGVKTFTCECGDSYTETITATGHNYEEVADSATPATCDTDGKEADAKCSLCESVVEGAVITASGHSYGEYIYNNDATTSADGTETATCSVCGGKTSRTKAGTKLALENFPHALNSPWYDASTNQVYFYTVGKSDPTMEPYTTAFAMLEPYAYYDGGIVPLKTVGKFNEYVGTYAEGDIYLSSARVVYE